MQYPNKEFHPTILNKTVSVMKMVVTIYCTHLDILNFKRIHMYMHMGNWELGDIIQRQECLRNYMALTGGREGGDRVAVEHCQCIWNFWIWLPLYTYHYA